MPTKPKRPCAYPGCPRLTDGQYCEEHRKEMNRQYNKYERAPDVHKKYEGKDLFVFHSERFDYDKGIIDHPSHGESCCGSFGTDS